jgi:hypothetical protein
MSARQFSNICDLTMTGGGRKVAAVRRFAAILLLAGFLGLGTGGLQYLHEMQHAAEDARQDAAAKKAGLPVLPHQHDESTCEFCAQLHLQFVVIGWVPILICLGLLIAFLTLLDTPLIPRAIPARIDCRGPPAGW